jgi:glycosyltransferase involved in cell wall biosynthesis
LGLAWKRVSPTTRIIFDAHEDIPGTFEYKTYLWPVVRRLLAGVARRALRWILPRYDGLVAATPWLGEQLAGWAPRVPLVVVENFPRLEDFPAPTVPWRERTACAVYLGSLSEARGIPEMLTAWETPLPGALRLIGPWHGHAAAPTLPEGVTMTGRLPGAEAIAAARDAQIGICVLRDTTNYRHAAPTKVWEYFAMGLPVVVTDLPTQAAMVQTAQAGVVIPPGDAGALREAVDWLWSHPLAAAAMGASGRRWLDAHGGWRSQGEALVAWYRTLAGTVLVAAPEPHPWGGPPVTPFAEPS